ncbi:MAG: T9SS type A sorting domain-containing protein [Saprospiraceae bacterium]|nr:T9SS type A sorting domain-containing protein [Saprospiraceae bacterium]
MSNSIFSQAGDQYEISTLSTVDNFVLTAGSASKTTWDFTGLYTEFLREDTVSAAIDGAAYADFSNTEIIQDLLAGFGGDAYVDVTSTDMTRLGGGIEFFGNVFVSPYIDPHKIQEAPLNYGGTFSDSYSIAFAENIDSIPLLANLIDSFISLPIDPDSIRLNFTGTQTSTIDAWGDCIMPDTTYDVLRQRVSIQTEFKIEARVVIPILGPQWQDITSLVLGAAPIPIPTTGSEVYYDYLSEGYRQPIVRINMDDTETAIESIDFMGEFEQDTTNVSVLSTLLESSDFQVFPNPSDQLFTVDLGEQTNAVSAQLVNVMGQKVAQLSIPNQQQFVIPTSKLANGNYWLSIHNKKGQIIGRKQVCVQH